jgi:hypothetical protein
MKDPEKFGLSTKNDSTFLLLLLLLTVVTRLPFLLVSHKGWDETIYTILVMSLDRYGIFTYSLNTPLSTGLPSEVTSNIAFNLPLFVNPPLFSFILFFLARMIGEVTPKNIASAAFILNIASVFLIASLVYKIVYFLSNDRKVGLSISVVAISEPVLWLSSLKIWMDTFIGALSALLIFYYLQAFKRGQMRDIILAGIAGGLLLETKLSSIPLVFCILIHSLSKIRENRKLLVVPLMSLSLLLPWIIWNYLTYGFNIPIGFVRYTSFHVPEIYTIASHPLAYFIYLPTISPVTVFGYYAVIKSREKNILLRNTLIVVTIMFSLISATRELRYITPLIPIHMVLAGTIMSKKGTSRIYPLFSLIMVYNTLMVITHLLVGFKFDILLGPFSWIQILIDLFMSSS